MSDTGNRIYNLILAALAFCILWLLPGCSSIGLEITPTEDTTYLTPIPMATIYAFKQGASIDNKLDAVMAARIELMSPPHFKPVGSIKTLYAEKLKLSDAYQRVGNPATYSAPSLVGDTIMWLVVFESDIQVNPPGQLTPNPPFHGCSYVLINAVGGIGGEVGGIECAKFGGNHAN